MGCIQKNAHKNCWLNRRLLFGWIYCLLSIFSSPPFPVFPLVTPDATRRRRRRNSGYLVDTFVPRSFPRSLERSCVAVVLPTSSSRPNFLHARKDCRGITSSKPCYSIFMLKQGDSAVVIDHVFFCTPELKPCKIPGDRWLSNHAALPRDLFRHM